MEPQDFLAPSQYYKTEADLETALTGVYSTLHDGALYKNYMLGRLGLDADLGYDNRDGDVGTSSQYLTAASDVKVEGFWQSLYKGINNANRLLAEVDNPDSAFPAQLLLFPARLQFRRCPADPHPERESNQRRAEYPAHTFEKGL